MRAEKARLEAIATAVEKVGLKPVYLDTETTGTSPMDEVIEVGIVDFDGRPLVDTFVGPHGSIPWEATKVHGITNEMVKHAPPFFSALAMLTAVMKSRVPVAYNASFDHSFLVNELRTISIYQELPAFRAETEWIDPLVWVRYYHKFAKGKKLTDMCPRLGVKLDDAHRAESDAKATGEVLFKLAEGSETSKDNKIPLHSIDYVSLIERQQQLAREQECDYQQWKARKGT